MMEASNFQNYNSKKLIIGEDYWLHTFHITITNNNQTMVILLQLETGEKYSLRSKLEKYEHKF